MCKLGVISQERLKIKAKLLLSANIGSHIYAASIGDSVLAVSRIARYLCGS